MERVDELDAVAVSDALAASTAQVMAAEAQQFFLAAHWADLHAPLLVEDQHTAWESELPGTPGWVPAGAEGTPLIGEFAGAELAALVGRSTVGGEQLVADAVNVRHRHPLLWAGIRGGTVRVWLAAKVARRCAATGLTMEQARWVDTETTPYLTSLPVARFLALVEAKIIAADPDAAAERARQAALARFVRSSQTDENGLRTLVARARAGDVLYLVAVLDRLAEILRTDGHAGTLDERRAAALRILANPARALALLAGATLEALEETDREPQETLFTPATSDQVESVWEVTTCGHHVAVPAPTDEPNDPVQPGDPGHDRGRVLSASLLRQVLAALDGFDPVRLDPVSVFHIHVGAEDLIEGQGLARMERVGPIVLGELRAWLGEPYTYSKVHARPVLDLTTQDSAGRSAGPAIDRYEVPDRMREVVLEANPYEVFPWGTLPTRRCDLDHIRPYDPDGSPGQTSVENLAPLSRRHHRIKTHGGWILRHPRPGEYWWRTPTGHWFSVTRDGTHHHGRDAQLDSTLAA